MNKVKPWQLAVIVIGLLVGVASLGYSIVQGGEVKLNHIITLVDVQDGQLYEFDNRNTGVIIPARHPETGKIALLRVFQENNEWKVIDRDMQLLGSLDEGVKNEVVDPASGVAKVKSGPPQKYRLPPLKQ